MKAILTLTLTFSGGIIIRPSMTRYISSTPPSSILIETRSPLVKTTMASHSCFFLFLLSGFGMFRLARTLSASNSVAWVAAIALIFIPYRFHHLAHLPLIFAGWIPLLFEALILFARERSWRRAGWLGVTFFMNALTCFSWFILVLFPLAVSGVLLLARY